MDQDGVRTRHKIYSNLDDESYTSRYGYEDRFLKSYEWIYSSGLYDKIKNNGKGYDIPPTITGNTPSRLNMIKSELRAQEKVKLRRLEAYFTTMEDHFKNNLQETLKSPPGIDFDQ